MKNSNGINTIKAGTCPVDISLVQQLFLISILHLLITVFTLT